MVRPGSGTMSYAPLEGGPASRSAPTDVGAHPARTAIATSVAARAGPAGGRKKRSGDRNAPVKLRRESPRWRSPGLRMNAWGKGGQGLGLQRPEARSEEGRVGKGSMSQGRVVGGPGH